MPWLTSGSQVSKIIDPAIVAVCLVSKMVIPVGRPGIAVIQ